MFRWMAPVVCLLALGISAGAFGADADLVKMAQTELIKLGYDPGNIQGEMSTETIVAISKFQAEHDMEVTGEVTPQLIGVLRAAGKQTGQPAAATAAAATPAPKSPEQEEADLRARQQACLEEKYAAAQARQKKKSGLMRLMSAVSRTSNQFGGSELSRTIGATTSTVYSANATAEDLSAAARDLGLTEDEVEECRNPQ
jgi:peptidoglycan hydrolase-like protein with peptidoglycan-binding domain